MTALSCSRSGRRARRLDVRRRARRASPMHGDGARPAARARADRQRGDRGPAVVDRRAGAAATSATRVPSGGDRARRSGAADRGRSDARGSQVLVAATRRPAQPASGEPAQRPATRAAAATAGAATAARRGASSADHRSRSPLDRRARELARRPIAGSRLDHSVDRRLGPEAHASSASITSRAFA